MIAGDFDEIVAKFEKKDGNDNFCNLGFKDCIDRNGLIDMGYYGQPFTWVSSSSSLTPIRIRLDYVICNIRDKQTFHKAFVRHLPRIG